MKKLLLAAALGLAVSSGALAVKPAPVKCPVSGETVKNIKHSAGTSTYKGKTYYFCCPGCKPEFDKNPEKYLKAKK